MKIMKVLRAIGNWILFLLTGKGELAEEMVEAGVLSYEGQGRDPNGR